MIRRIIQIDEENATDADSVLLHVMKVQLLWLMEKQH